MKILIVNLSDTDGGAARAAYRLHKALLTESVNSKMLVQNKFTDDFTVLGPVLKIEKEINNLRPGFDRLPVRFYKNRINTVFSPSWLPFSRVVTKINNMNPDIVHLHWICDGMIRIEDLVKIKAQIVWSLHDNWAFTGGCHVKWSCEKYKEKCGACPQLSSNKEDDLSRKIWKRKHKAYSGISNLTIVALSQWMVNCAKESSLLFDKEIKYLPNPIFTDLFKPFNKKKAKELWNLSNEKKIILFGAKNALVDINKGFKEFNEALKNIKDQDIEIVVFGSSGLKDSEQSVVKTHYLGDLSDDISLITLYNAADLLVVPSLQENLSNSIMEALSCSTPVAAFNIGGNSDMIEHQKNGYLAKPLDAIDLANGIEWILNSPDYEKFCTNAREKILREFDRRVVVKKYIELYKEILNN